MTTTVVWTEIPVTDLAKAEAFYTAVFQWEMKRDLSGPNPMTNFTDDMSSTGGHLCPSSEFSGEPRRFHNGGTGSVSV
jgi:predicted enzyme related to lactoylglutathione lyase